eukprot:TRINITY_DN3546_c0_g1_i1.p1 TRINITY_DN3546_c0_g1~~TRINITY_DN3546_c0_g1_i1.p1  ORF type:complete len:1137 (-),score=300.82 TRINITY_DN3546_c0_g1_i1:18-3428(-)
MRYIFIFIIACFVVLFAKQTSAALNVHLIPHSHCDPGWLETFEGYFNGRVSRILTNVVNELSKDPTRTFVWAEISFFERWYETQSDDVKTKLKKLIDNKQFEFVAGGWVQNDEANAHYHQVIDQVTEGHQYLWENFKVKPRVAWQIDPFGHSSLTPSLFAKAGFDALVINRIHFDTKTKYKAAKHMEFIWHGLNQADAKIMTHVLHTHYSAPQGFDFEESWMTTTDENKAKRARELVNILTSRGQVYRTDNLLVPWGDDFKFVDAAKQFNNMDPLVKYINANPDFGVNIQYSTLSRYFDALNKAKTEFPSFFGDFFPYADNADSYWTGYYTTRPALKLHSREVDAMIKSAETGVALANHKSVQGTVPNGKKILNIAATAKDLMWARRNSALVQHHDGITGTARGFVAQDYTNRLDSAYNVSKVALAKSLSVLLAGDKTAPEFDSELRVLDFEEKTDYVVAVHNSLGWPRKQFQHLTVKSKQKIIVTDAAGNQVVSEMIPVDPLKNATVFHLYFLAEVSPLGAETYFLKVDPETSSIAAVPTTQAWSREGYSGPKVDKIFTVAEITHAEGSEAAFIENDNVQVTFSSTNGLMGKIFNKKTGKTQQLNQDLMAYTGASRSGAYIMRTGNPASTVIQKYLLIIYKGEHVQEARIILGNDLEWHIKLYSTEATTTQLIIEQDYKVKAESATEVVVKYRTGIATGSEHFYTDNGVEVLQRTRVDNRPEHNYYPCISMAFVKCETADERLTILNRHSIGATSPVGGTLELMIHRNLPHDDGRGLAEPNNDRSTVATTLWALYSNNAVSNENARELSLLLNNPMRSFIAKDSSLTQHQENLVDTWKENFETSYRPMKYSLPSNVHITTLRYLAGEESLLLRLMHTSEGSDKIKSDLAKKTKLEIQEFFNAFKVQFIGEKSLTITQPIEEQESTRRVWKSSGVSDLSNVQVDEAQLDKQNTDEEGVFISKDALEKAGQEVKQEADSEANLARRKRAAPIEGDDITEKDVEDINSFITLHPTEIRTFEIKLVPRHTQLDTVTVIRTKASPSDKIDLPLQTIRVARGELLTVFLLAFVVIAVLVITTWKSRAEVIRSKKGIFSRIESGVKGTAKKRSHVPLTGVVVDSEGSVTVTNFNEQKSTKQH